MRTPCRKKLKTYILPKFGLLNQNLLVKRDEWERKSCCFDIFVRFTNYKNCQNWSINNAIFEMRHSEVPKITIFWKRIALGNFSRSFIFFVYLCLYIHSLPLKKKMILQTVKIYDYVDVQSLCPLFFYLIFIHQTIALLKL